MDAVTHYDRLMIPNITKSDNLPMEGDDYGKLRRSISFEFSVRDWNGNGYLAGRGFKLSLWNFVDELSAEIAQLDELLAATTREMEMENEKVNAIGNKYFLECADAKLCLDIDRADLMDEYERRLEWTEKREMKVMYQLKDSLVELRNVKRELRELEGKIKKDMAGGGEDRVNGKEPGPARGGAGEYVAQQMKKLAEARKVIDDDDDAEERGENVGCFSFLRRLFCCCRQKRRKKRRRPASLI